MRNSIRLRTAVSCLCVCSQAHNPKGEGPGKSFGQSQATSPGGGHSTQPTWVQEHLDNALRYMAWFWGAAVRSQELDFMILACGPHPTWDILWLFPTCTLCLSQSTSDTTQFHCRNTPGKQKSTVLTSKEHRVQTKVSKTLAEQENVALISSPTPPFSRGTIFSHLVPQGKFHFCRNKLTPVSLAQVKCSNPRHQTGDP